MNPENLGWALGARVLSNAEPELGIGILVRLEESVATFQFPQAKITRKYSLKNAPLRRALLSKGQKAKFKDRTEHKVQDLRFTEGLAQYCIEDRWYWEHELSTEQSDQGALEYFFNGHFSEAQAFDLRKESWKLKSESLNPFSRGLIGARCDLLAHQLYIAQEVSRRPQPRVLLADEVGLGKTIEAGLILSSLHQLGRAQKILIVVPESLKTQWLAELYRRFHLLFSILDEPRCLEEEKVNPTLSPYESNAFVLCTLEHFMIFENRLNQALKVNWDLLIFDEAHHLLWNPSDPSPAWLCAKKLSEVAQALLLLTATPRQHGLDTQFGLLNLVDPDRFADFERFKIESQNLTQLSEIARKLSEHPKDSLFKEIEKIFPDDEELKNEIQKFKSSQNLQPLLAALIDRHGPGRVIYRNRRARLKGFPERKCLAVELEGTQHQGEWDCSFSKNHPKLKWLVKFLNDNPLEKILLITSLPSQVKLIDQFLLENFAIKRALFHDEMEMVERDRQAAWFADPKGARLLIASEIGGEGRNFQFCKKLILFNLPPEPDLVEQRIGRLDRIGQKFTIEIIVPIIKDSVENLHFDIFQNGLSLFQKATAGLGALIEDFKGDIAKLCDELRTKQVPLETLKEHKSLVQKIAQHYQKYQEGQEKNFDYLVDFNSFNEEVGRKLQEKLDQLDRKSELEDFMERIFEFFGIEEEELSSKIKKITAHSLMFVESFPELSDEKSLTYSRQIANTREEIDFLTLDHPMLSGVLSLFLDKELGRAAILKARSEALSSGALFEMSFVLQSPSVKGINPEHFLRPHRISLFCDHTGKPVEEKNLKDLMYSPLSELELKSIKQSLPRLRSLVPQFLENLEKQARVVFSDKLKKSQNAAIEQFDLEIDRLNYLSRINKIISKKEILLLEQQKSETLKALSESPIHLDSLCMGLINA